MRSSPLVRSAAVAFAVVAAMLGSARADAAPSGKLEAAVVANADAVVEKTGEPEVQFVATHIVASDLANKRLVWTLFVKRKLAPWTAARNYPLGTSFAKSARQPLPDVKGALLYATLATDGFLPGEHEAAVVATVAGKEVFREELSFVLKAHAFHPLAKPLPAMAGATARR